MQNIYSVSQVNSYIKNMFAQDTMLGLVYVRGEVSNLKYHSSRHIYFTLKDAGSAMACVMFAGDRRGLAFTMQEGMEVVVKGNVAVYERDGKYQLYAKEIRQQGQGNLSERFEELKKRLLEMGMFSNEYKQPIPKYVKKLGVVTAPTGAAVQDIIRIATRRNPYIEIILYPAIVQGDKAADSICKGIAALESFGVDAMIVGRGGGSIEDLWAFNEEKVAQAIFDCQVPIISAVGHETDFTIADFVADVRASTPSAAAELAVINMEDLLERLQNLKNRLQKNMDNQLLLRRNRLQEFELLLGQRSPEQNLQQYKMTALQLEDRLQNAMEGALRNSRHRMELLLTKLEGLSPLQKLKQGYGHIENAEGKTISSIKQVQEGDFLKLYVEDGLITAKVESREHLVPIS